MSTYAVNEVFYSVQGEGVRAGTANVFIRFSGCNLTCRYEHEGFDCDTEFSSGYRMSGGEILTQVKQIAPMCKAIIFTGGEPALQLDAALVNACKREGYYLAIETNGTKELPQGLDWITVSPKTAEHTLRQRRASEVKYVRHARMALPKPSITAEHYLLSPAFQPSGTAKQDDLDWCVELVKENPLWRLSLQTHKLLKQR